MIVGGGPAGLSAALVLGRCRRRVLVCDAGRPRNARALRVNGLLGRDGIPPLELLQIARQQLRAYSGVKLHKGEVSEVRPGRRAFVVRLAGGGFHRARFVLLATGLSDRLPHLPGLHRLFGTSVFHCPYCDGWEMRDRPLAVYGRGHKAAGLALELTLWSRDVVLCTDGPARLGPEDRRRLAVHGIEVREERVARLQGRAGRLQSVVFADGATLPREGLFLAIGQRQRSPLAVRLGCAFTRKGTLRTSRFEMTSVPGLYAAGDCSRDVQLVIIAAAEGARAAFAINESLMRDEMKKTRA